jgi:hypothetical protein
VDAGCDVQMLMRLSFFFNFLYIEETQNYLKDWDFNRDSNLWASYTHILILRAVVYLKV